MKRVVLCLLAALIGVPAARVLYVHPDSTRNCVQECLGSCHDGDIADADSGAEHRLLPLKPSPNDVSRLSPSVYIVRDSRPAISSAGGPGVRKEIPTR